MSSEDLAIQEQKTEVSEQSRASTMSIVTNDQHMANVMTLAKMMAESKVTIPKHLQGNVGDCAAIVMQAMNWGMDHNVVAQKTHLVNGVLGYEAQLVNSVVTATNSIKGRFHYEYKDESGTGPNTQVSCRVGAILRGEEEITWGEWLNSSTVTTKNSPLWKTNVKQQMGYLQVKNWARLYTPSAIMGVYTPEELIETKDINKRPPTAKEAAEKAKGGVVIDAAQEEERELLIADLEEIAGKGVQLYAEAFGSLTRNQRKLLGTEEHERLKAIAMDAPMSQPEKEVKPEVDADFVDAMEDEEKKAE